VLVALLALPFKRLKGIKAFPLTGILVSRNLKLFSIALRIVGLVLGFLLGLRISTAKRPPIGYTEPNSLYAPPDHSIQDVDVIMAVVIAMVLFKILNYFFNEEKNAGIGEFIAGSAGGFVFGIIFLRMIPTIYHWFF
jgi:hypothetical protein